MIQISNLKYSYPQSEFKLSIEALNVPHNNSLGIIGPSGSGKTTLLQLISGILKPDSGNIFLDKFRVGDLTKIESRKWRASNIGFVFQDFQLFEYLNVAENILMPLHISKANIKQGKKRMLNLCENAGIDHLLDKKPGRISQGEKQRVALIRALIHNPKLILADEPTGNLDPENKEIAIKLLLQFSKENNATLIAVTHDHELLHHFNEILDFKTLRL